MPNQPPASARLVTYAHVLLPMLIHVAQPSPAEKGQKDACMTSPPPKRRPALPHAAVPTQASVTAASLPRYIPESPPSQFYQPVLGSLAVILLVPFLTPAASFCAKLLILFFFRARDTPNGREQRIMSYHEREYRSTRYKEDDYDDDKYKSTTVRRYKVGGNGDSSSTTRVDRIRRYDDFDDARSTFSHRDDYRDSHSHFSRPAGEVVEVDKRVEKTYLPERPRSAFDPPVQRTVVEKKIIERDDRDRDRDDRYRYTERDIEYSRGETDRRERDMVVEREREPERRDRVVRETRETVTEQRNSPMSPRERDWDRRSRMPWEDDRDDVRVEKRVEHRTEEHGDHVDDVRVEKRVERRSDDHVDDVKVEKRIERFHEDDHDHHHHHHGGDIERYRKEVEYYAPADPPPQPIVIRQKAPEPQQIIVQEAPAPPPVIIDRQTDPGYLVLRENDRQVARRDPRDDEYYYRREERRDDDYAMERYDRRRRDYQDDDEDVYVKRTIIRRERSTSADHHRRRHLAEGGLAGAGLAALVSSRRGRDGDLPENRGKKVLAGAALGALGTEVIRRARSAYDDHYDDRYDDRYYDDDYHRHHRSRSKSRSRLTTGLAIVSIMSTSVSTCTTN